MIVAISGSWKDYKRKVWNLKRNRAEFAEACREIGSKLAEHGHRVIIGSQSPNTADPHVVEGIAAYVRGRGAGKTSHDPLVNILRPRDELFPFRRLSQDMPQLFSRYEKEEPNWDAAHLLAVERADAVLVIGGSDSSYLAGLSAITSGKTLIPVGAFGGAGRELLDRLLARTAPDGKEEYRPLYGPWTHRVLDQILELLVTSLHATSSAWVYDLFLSFSSQDRHIAEAIVERAERLGLRCFAFTRGLRGGDIYAEMIRKAIRSSREMAVIVSERSLRSKWVKFESAAGWGLQKRITPILVNLKPASLPLGLRGASAYSHRQVRRYLKDIQERARADDSSSREASRLPSRTASREEHGLLRRI